MSANELIYIGSDHAGFSLKKAIMDHFRQTGLRFEDCGTHGTASCNYPDYAAAVSQKVLQNQGRGILICGSGIGMSIAANRYKGIRAALCTHEFHAKACRAHNDANILCLGERVTAPGLAMEMVRLFLETPFEGGRHQVRVELMDTLSY